MRRTFVKMASSPSTLRAAEDRDATRRDASSVVRRLSRMLGGRAARRVVGASSGCGHVVGLARVVAAMSSSMSMCSSSASLAQSWSSGGGKSLRSATTRELRRMGDADGATVSSAAVSRTPKRWRGKTFASFSSSSSSTAFNGAFADALAFARENPGAKAVTTPEGRDVTYGALMRAAGALAEELGAEMRPGTRVGLAATPGAEYCVSAYAAWSLGGVVVPIASSHSDEDAGYVMKHSGMDTVLVPPLADGSRDEDTYEKYLRVKERFGLDASVRHVGAVSSDDGASALSVNLQCSAGPDDGALIIYTSGTTGRPKGALHTHRSLGAQCAGLVQAWRWDSSDRVVHALPLHHIHGIVNAWLCAHVAGATVEFQRTFTPRGFWSRLRDETKPAVTVFMGVPTMYVMLLRTLHGNMPAEARAECIEAASKLRLTVSGSAACPLPILEEWRRVTGRSLLERYGMTEIGMALSNPYDESKHKPGYVGIPLPGVQVKLSSIDDDVPEAQVDDGEFVEGPGELLVKGDNLFSEYFDNPTATAESFDADGYFMTGDVAAKSADGFWRILGRASVDILKVGGYKVSALEIEARLLENPSIAEVAVLGIPDEAYGQRAVALVVHALDTETGEPVNLTEGDVIKWARENLASKMHLRRVKFVDKMPRNAMGKINKKDLQRTVFKEFFEDA